MTAVSRPTLEEFYATLAFAPDDYQRAALEAFADGHTIVVTAPTGAGKTLIAEGAIALTLADGTRAFYTTPIKALSNQKFSDLRSEYGPERVGLLTGDNVINGDADIVVMTTEVLRNMIYDDSPALHGVGVVVLDEVHYLADRARGSVWEEVIIHLDRSVPIVCLSATIANPEEFTGWVRSRRGEASLIIEDHRPVPLTPMYMWSDRHHGGEPVMQPIFGRNGRPNAAITKALQRSRGRHRRFSTPRRVDVVRELAEDGLLPAIYFVFSRKGCDATARQLAAAHLGLTTSDERRAIVGIVERHVAHLSAEDLAVLGYDGWLATLERGAAPHHAGLVPAFKEATEELFLEGLVKVVAATETLALGINMPARTVVLESLSKFTGESHELLQASEFTQLTGRAGRRGIDDHGTAVVLYSSYVPFERVSGIAGTGSNALRSSFAPSYNMTVNLIARYDESMAHDLLAASFANYADDERRRNLAANLDDRRRDVATFRRAAACDLGNIWDVLDQGDPWPAGAKPDTTLLASGTVVEYGKRRRVVLSRSWGGQHPRVDLTDSTGTLTRTRSRDLPRGTVILGSINLPQPVRTADPNYRREAANLLEVFVPDEDPTPFYDTSERSPVLTCPDLDDHLHWADRARRAERDVRRLERRIERSTRHDVVVDFDRLHAVLDRLGYTERWKLLAGGESLRRLYNELDLVLAESLRAGVFDGREPAEFGAIASMFTFESRGGEVPQPPHAMFADAAIVDVEAIWTAISDLEATVGLEPTRQPDPGLVDTIHGWASGLELDDLFDEEDVRAGDFVRAARQVLDLLRQIRDGYPDHRAVASRAIDAIDRGIVTVEIS